MIVLFFILIIGFFAGLFYCLQKVLFQGQLHFLLYFLTAFLPFYITLQSLTFQYTGSVELVSLLKYIKEITIFLSLIAWLLFKRNVFSESIRLLFPDYLFLFIILYASLFVILPIGPLSFFGKALYFKNILVLALMYFFGRIMVLKDHQINNLLKIILALTVIAFFVNVLEKSTNTHFQSISGYTLWLEEIENSIPSGNYDLTWTFEAQSGAKRFAAFFASPLELAAAMLLSFSTALVFLLNSKGAKPRLLNSIALFLSIGCLFFAYSRAALGGFFLLLFFIALTLGYYRFIVIGGIALLVFFGIIFVFASEDLRYFVIDSINLADTSSLGHLVEWIEGLQSMSTNPLGIGLGTSGNASGVNSDFKVGGENQFIVFGVQLGIPFLLIYISLLVTSIYYSVKAYRLGTNLYTKAIPFIAATFKFAFLMPLMTANAEIYAYVAYLSWWMVGYSVTLYDKGRR